MTKRDVWTLCTEPAVSLRMPRKLKVLGTCLSTSYAVCWGQRVVIITG